MTEQTGFKLLGNNQARILILGSMPSVISLAKRQYYGHPRNAFWPIMVALFNKDKPIAYQQGEQLLEAQGVAVWDVLESCARKGSLDSAIEQDAIKVNDFKSLFAKFSEIEYVFFNGGTAELLYKKHVCQTLPIALKRLNYAKLPSTSPAYAAMRYKEKLAIWSVIKDLTETKNNR